MTGRERKEYIRRARITHLKDQDDARKEEDQVAIRLILHLVSSLLWLAWSAVLVSLVWDQHIGAILVAVVAICGGAWVIKNDFGKWPWAVFNRR